MAVFKGESGSNRPKLDEKVSFLLNKWDGKNFYILKKDDEIWLTFELSFMEKLALLKALLRDWIEIN